MLDSRVNSAEELAGNLGVALQEVVGSDVLELFPTLVRLLAEGRPVSPEEIAAAAELPLARVESLLDRGGAERDESGAVVGAGLTLRPTPHRFTVEGQELYTWCALDTLIFPALLGTTAHVESPCHATSRPVRVTVTPTEVQALDPASAVVSFLVADAGPIRHAFCDYVHFFSSAAAAEAWLEQHSGAVVQPVAEAFRIGRVLAGTGS